jgi:hypothetical protein
MRRTEFIPVVAVIMVALVTLLGSLAGPDPSTPTDSELLYPSALAATLREPADRIILPGWWVLAIDVALYGHVLLPEAGLASTAQEGRCSTLDLEGTTAYKVGATSVALVPIVRTPPR